MPVTNDNYDQLKIDKLKHYLESQSERGIAKPFEIFVDNLKVVPKTEDPKEFDTYEFYMNEDTEKVRILIYNSNLSPRNDQYCFYVQKTAGAKSLNGLGEIENIVQEKLAARDREYEMTRLREELEATKEELAETEEACDKLQKEIEHLKANKFKLGSMNVPEFLGDMVGSWVKKNPQVLARLPIAGEALAGIMQESSTPQEPAPDLGQPSNVSFQKESGDALSEEDKRTLAYFKSLEEKVPEGERKGFNIVLHAMVEEPGLIAIILDLITAKK